MKKITIKDSIQLEVRLATCSFCGESYKKCVRGIVPFKGYGMGKTVWVIKDYEYVYPFLGEPFMKVRDYDLETLLGEYRIQGHANICYDCIKQLNKLIN